MFIDFGAASLKAVLLGNGAEMPSFFLLHAFGLKEIYNNMELVLLLIRYSNYHWSICGDLKIIGFLLGDTNELCNAFVSLGQAPW